MVALLMTLDPAVHRACADDAPPTIGARNGAVVVSGAQIIGGAEEIVVADGPLPRVQSLAAADEAGVEATFRLAEPIGSPATISFWLRPRIWYRNGDGREALEHTAVEIAGLAEFFIRQAPEACLVYWDWARPPIEGVDSLGNYIPELPGPEWYHVLVTWDSRQGVMNMFVNGAPQRIPGVANAPWAITRATDITLRLGHFRIADLRVEPKWTTPEQARARVPSAYRDRRADLMGAPPDRDPVETAGRLGALLYESSLGSRDAIEGWVMEGPGVLEFGDGWMQMSSALVDGRPKGHIVHWCPEDFPERFVAEWGVRIVSERGLNIVFFAARGEHGEDIFDPGLPERTGVFNQYVRGAIISYHISYYANVRITSNLRKNNRFYLVANGPPGIFPRDREWHSIRLIKDGAHIQLLCDDRLIVDYIDDGVRYGPVYGAGKIGFRQMEPTIGRYRNLRVWELLPAWNRS